MSHSEGRRPASGNKGNLKAVLREKIPKTTFSCFLISCWARPDCGFIGMKKQKTNKNKNKKVQKLRQGEVGYILM